MIAKCARADCMRSAFPVLFAGAYDQAEIGDIPDALEGGLVVDARIIDMDTGEIQEPVDYGTPPTAPETEAKPEPEPDEPVAEGEPFPSDEDEGERILDDAVGPSASQEARGRGRGMERANCGDRSGGVNSGGGPAPTRRNHRRIRQCRRNGENRKGPVREVEEMI